MFFPQTSRDTFDDIFTEKDEQQLGPPRHVKKGRPKSKQSNGRQKLEKARQEENQKVRQTGPRRNRSHARQRLDTEESEEDTKTTDNKKARHVGGRKAKPKSRSSRNRNMSETELVENDRKNDTKEGDEEKEARNNNNCSKSQVTSHVGKSELVERPSQPQIEKLTENLAQKCPTISGVKFDRQPVIKLDRLSDVGIVRKRGRPPKIVNTEHVVDTENVFPEITAKKKSKFTREIRVRLIT